jgi:hypothetical protein
MKDNIKVICEVDPAVKLCCVNADCLNHVANLNVCNLKNVVIGSRHVCAGYVRVKHSKPKIVKNQSDK